MSDENENPVAGQGNGAPNSDQAGASINSEDTTISLKKLQDHERRVAFLVRKILGDELPADHLTQIVISYRKAAIEIEDAARELRRASAPETETPALAGRSGLLGFLFPAGTEGADV